MTEKIYTFRCEEELIKKLDLICSVLGISRSEAIREAIQLYINAHPFRERKKDIKVVRVVLK